MHSAICHWIIWLLLLAVFRTVQYAGAVPVTYSREQVFSIRDSLPATPVLPVLPVDALKQIRGYNLNSIPATVRGCRGGRKKAKDRARV